jgi:DNA replication ATP-dependent helicase Dna2
MTTPIAAEQADSFYDEIRSILADQALVGSIKTAHGFGSFLDRFFTDLVADSRVTFNVFSTIVYWSQELQLQAKEVSDTHQFRSMLRKSDTLTPDLQDQLAQLGLGVVCRWTQYSTAGKIPADLAKKIQKAGFLKYNKTQQRLRFEQDHRVTVIEVQADKYQFLAKSEDNPDQIITVIVDPEVVIQDFLTDLRQLGTVIPLPCVVNLIDVSVETETIWRPKGWVIEPDYLMDVTAVAEAYKPDGHHVLGYLLRKFLPYQNTSAIVVGNLANQFLDQLVKDPTLDFKDLYAKVFHQAALHLTGYDNNKVKELLAVLQIHFNNIQDFMLNGMPEQGIDREKCYIEPSFFSTNYGLQGRLDLLHRPDDPESTKHIIELKSGKLFMPNQHNINNSHYIQTLLYYLMVREAFEEKKVNSFIFYSRLDETQLRFAPPDRQIQLKAVALRNRLLQLEYKLMQAGPKGIFDRLDNYRKSVFGFDRQNLETFLNTWEKLSELEIEFFTQFTGFIAREHLLAKLGTPGEKGARGTARLWLNDENAKIEQFEILHRLAIIENKSQDDEPILVLKPTELTPAIANFRLGDMVVLYHHIGEDQHIDEAVLRDQVFKGTLIEYSNERIVFRFRSPVLNQQIFDSNPFWAIEQDSMDSGFLHMYRGLFAWASSDKEKRALVIGESEPAKPEISDLPRPAQLTDRQWGVWQAMVLANDYYLLWGPPGSGKTSTLLHHYVDYLLKNTQQTILLLAYTNRAVDEICESIEAIGTEVREQYFRIGSRYSTRLEQRDRLLDHLLAETNSRSDVRYLLSQTRIVVATIASFQGKLDLLELMNFDIAIIDEASQLLEPQIIGLLPLFPKTVLIGDHLQLPAVVQQDERLTQVKSENLQTQLGFTDLRCSYFERMYRRCQEKGWNHALGMLSEQGRMHQSIGDYPANAYYQGQLFVLPFKEQQTAIKEKQHSVWQQKRVAFIHSAPQTGNSSVKTHEQEAEIISKLVASLRRNEDNKQSIGIIAPYRAQIACIRGYLEKLPCNTADIIVDTVERYQGSACDIILMSLCVHSKRQASQLVSLTIDGVDRKFNVALTRAREQLVVVGQQSIIEQVPSFKHWLQWIDAHDDAGFFGVGEID